MELMSGTWTDERLDEFHSEVTGRFDDVDRRFDRVDCRFAEVDRRFDQVDRRFAEVDHRFDRVELRFGQLDEKFDEKFVSVNQRLDGVEGALQNQSAEWRAEIKAVRAEIKVGFDGLHRLMIHAGIVLGAALIGLIGAVLVVAIV
jgi:DNA anti-recombination protein RmuC